MMMVKSVTGYGKCVTRYGILQICYGLLRKYHTIFRIIPLFFAISVTAERKRYKKKRKENSEARSTTCGYVDKSDLLGNRNVYAARQYHQLSEVMQ